METLSSLYFSLTLLISFSFSYPSRGPQSYSEHRVASTTLETNFIYSLPILGETMGGSSGSPIVNDRNEFVGQHYGWSRMKATYCTAEAEYDKYYIIDGAFSSTYPMIADILGVTPTSEPTSGSSCTDSNTYSFGSYTQKNGETVTRNCAWITKNASRVTKRRNRWCDKTVEGKLVQNECPDACNSKTSCVTSSPTSRPSLDPSNKPTSTPSGGPTQSPSNESTQSPSYNEKETLEPSSISSPRPCIDSSTFIFGWYTKPNGKTMRRNCAWITKNVSKVERRKKRWCDKVVVGRLVKEECPVRCELSTCTLAVAGNNN